MHFGTLLGLHADGHAQRVRRRVLGEREPDAMRAAGGDATGLHDPQGGQTRPLEPLREKRRKRGSGLDLERAPEVAVDRSCFGGRVLSFRDLVAEVVIPSGESCDAGTFQVVFTRPGLNEIAWTRSRLYADRD